MKEEFIIGDEVRGRYSWNTFSDKTTGVIIDTYPDEDDDFTWYVVRYKDGDDEVEDEFDEDSIRLKSPKVNPVFKVEFIALGMGAAVHQFRAADMNEAEKVVAGLVKGNPTSIGKDIPALMNCKRVPTDWKERIIIMYIKQVTR